MPRLNSDHICESQAFPCTLEKCEAVFTRKSDRGRHERRHLPYAERPFKCNSCDFRANQKSGLQCHENSVHLKKRLPCRDPQCDRDFSDPSTLSRHMNRRHKSSSKKGLTSWTNFTSKFKLESDPAPVDATVAHGSTCESGKLSVNGDHITSSVKLERRSPDVSSANVTLHTSPVGRQEGFSCQSLLSDKSLISFAPSPLSPLVGPVAPYQPDWQFQSSSGYYSSLSGIDYPACSTSSFPGSSLPEMTVMTPFQFGVGMPDAKPAEQSVDNYFRTLLETPVEQNFQSSSDSWFYPAANTFPSGSSHMVPPLANFDPTRSLSDLFSDATQRWQVDNHALNFGHGASRGMEYYPRFSQFNGLSAF